MTKATQYLYELAIKLLELKGSDIFITAGSPPALKINQDIRRVSGQNLSPQQDGAAGALDHERPAGAGVDDQHHEVNFSLNFPDVARFRVSAFTQRGSAGMVLRLIQQQIPTIEELNLPPILRDIAMAKRGLVIFLGGTGCGKTTSMAAMLDHRNSHAGSISSRLKTRSSFSIATSSAWWTSARSAWIPNPTKPPEKHLAAGAQRDPDR
jgi:twitching motility protein PilU